MDFNSVSSMYGDISSTATKNAELEKMKQQWQEQAKGTDEEKLMDACKQFEAYFVEQMFKEMQKTVPKDNYTLQSTGSMVDYTKENLIKEFASLTTESGELGLAQTLYDQMKVNLDAIPASELKNQD